MTAVRHPVLFDANPYRVKRARAKSADNAKNKREGRLVVAGGLIVDNDGRVLLLHRSSPRLAQWETPGGKVEAGESPRDAAVREVAEELGIEVEITRDLGWHDFSMGRTQLRYALYEMAITGGTPRAVEQDFDDCRFFRWKDALDAHSVLSANARAIVEMYYRGRLKLSAT